MSWRLCLAVVLPSLACCGLAAEPTLPKVVLIGDSIRLGYAPRVAALLKGKADIISPRQNGGDSNNVLKNLDSWVIEQHPDVVHINCGLHDLRFRKKTKTHQVEPDQYRNNLQAIIARIRKGTKAKIIFATTTPIHDERHARRGADFDRFEKDVQLYNKIAREVMKKEKVEINDLHQVIIDGGMENLLSRGRHALHGKRV
ncbi:MAG: hypothetical protein KatS3mg105_2852 [Gemmatales bacterium]|nr:MAG: hypothetical protein KatS3mg105_2852 [Gemmatales bacterium]